MLGDMLLPLTSSEGEVLSLLLLYVLQGHGGEVSLTDVRRLPGWRMPAQSIRSRLLRAAQRLERLGWPVMQRPTTSGETSGGLVLNRELVSVITHDLPDTAYFRAWVMGFPAAFRPDPEELVTWPAQHYVTLAIRCFERGEYDQTREFCHCALNHPACGPDQEILALARLAWVVNYTGNPAETREIMQKLREAYQQHGGDPSLALADQAKIQYHLQQARYAIRHLERNDVDREYERARHWIIQGGGAREWAAYFSGQQLLAWKDKEYEQAEELSRHVLHLAIQADWIWMQQVHAAYLGELMLDRFKRQATQKTPVLDASLLDEAAEFIGQAQRISKAERYGGPAETEFMLARLGRYRWWLTRLKHLRESPLQEGQNQRDLEHIASTQIEVWLREARGILEASHAFLDMAVLHLEWAELAFLRGEMKKVEGEFTLALNLAKEHLSANLQRRFQEDVAQRRRDMRKQRRSEVLEPRWE